MTVAELFDYADTHGVIIDDTFVLDRVRALSLPLPNDLCVIGLHPSLRGAAYKAQLAHELGHCATGAFYNERTPVFTRGQCEHRADRWAVQRLIPFRSLAVALRKGYTEIWQLAERFDLPGDFIVRAIEIYREDGKLPVGGPV